MQKFDPQNDYVYQIAAQQRERPPMNKPSGPLKPATDTAAAQVPAQDCFCPGDISENFSQNVLVRDDLYGITYRISGRLYPGIRDKGDDSHDSSIVNHVKRTEELTREVFAGHVSGEVLRYFEALALGHEFFDIKVPIDGDMNNRRQVYSVEQALDDGLPPEFARDLDALGIRPQEPYLDYIERLSCRARPALWKMKVDLAENRSPARNRAAIPPEKQNPKLRDKKDYLYEMAQLYIDATLSGQAVPGSSLPAFIMRDPSVPQRLKNADVLARHSSDRVNYDSVPESPWYRRWLESMRRPATSYMKVLSL